MNHVTYSGISSSIKAGINRNRARPRREPRRPSPLFIMIQQFRGHSSRRAGLVAEIDALSRCADDEVSGVDGDVCAATIRC